MLSGSSGSWARYGDQAVVGRRLLVVEDDASLRQCLTEYLAEAGFDVAEAEDGDHAATMLDDIDLLITDIDMPGRLDGNALAVRAKARHPNLPVIYSSGSPGLLMNEIKANDALLLKPVRASRVTEMVTCLLQTTEQPESLARPMGWTAVA